MFITIIKRNCLGGAVKTRKLKTGIDNSAINDDHRRIWQKGQPEFRWEWSQALWNPPSVQSVRLEEQQQVH